MNKLRNKFFAECTDKDAPGLPKVAMAPHDLFEWFKPYIKNDQCNEVTGFDTYIEWSAYEKGRKHEQSTISKWIEKWDGSTNSAMGDLLGKKLINFIECSADNDWFRSSNDLWYCKSDGNPDDGITIETLLEKYASQPF